jgi:uncharacterized protein YecE (DUF72 family)
VLDQDLQQLVLIGGEVDFLSVYARRFDTVEIDATFYRIPTAAQARSWAAKVPTGFKIAAKVPQLITHEKLLVGCADELKEFLDAMGELGEKLGPLLLQCEQSVKQFFRVEVFRPPTRVPYISIRHSDCC